MDDAPDNHDADEAKPSREEIRQKAPDLKVIYSNSVLVGYSNFDVVFHFGQVEESSPTRLVSTELVMVFMSPQHAKVLAGILSGRIEEYERRFGRIPTREIQTGQPNVSS